MQTLPFMRSTRRLGLVLATTIIAAATPRLVHAQGEIYGSQDLTALPKPVSAATTARLIARSYPERQRRMGVGGSVQVQFVIAQNGKVEPGSVEVVDATTPEFASAAKSVVEKLEFVPGKKDGNAVRARVQQQIIYKP